MISSEKQKSVQERINQYATQYGNKAANLMELNKYCKSIKSKRIKIAIPDIFPLSDQLIKSHLDQYLPEWTKQWQDFIEEQAQNKILTPLAIEKLKILRQNILSCFKEHPLDIKTITKSSLPKDNLFMVRSTGEEDTVDIANPGGNESVAAVKSDDESISNAIGVVVASYLSEKSLMQRLLSGDAIIKTPFMPVLLQTMIGEPVQGETDAKKIVVSGVMYAEQDMTRIDIAPGHGELIVNSKAPFDTYDVSAKGIVYPEIHHKATRLVPMDVKHADGRVKRKLQFKDNPKELQSAPALSPETAKSIAEIGQLIKKHYDIPMDIELVYQPWDATLYIVQARPIPMAVKHKIKPSTLSPKISAESQKKSANVISAGGNAARVITEKEQLLMTPGIGDALKTYLQKEAVQTQTKAVLVKNPSPSTSHEAAQFNALGIPVLQLDADSDEIAAELKEDNNVLVVDPQRHQVVSTKVKDKKDAEQELLENKTIVEGLFSSSLSPKLTLLPTKNIPNAHARVINYYLRKSPKVKAPSYEALLNSLEIIESAQPGEKNPQAFAALKYITGFYKQIATSTIGKQKESPHQKLFSHAMLTIADIHLSLKNYKKNAAQKTLLDLISKLKALAVNPGEENLYSDSIKQIAAGNKVLKEDKALKNNELFAAVATSATTSPYLIEFLRLNQVALNPRIKAAWSDFALFCSVTEKRRQALAKMMSMIAQYQLQSEFINQSFVELRKKEPDNLALLAKLMQEVNSNNTTYEKYEFDKNAQVIQSWERRHHEWTEPAKFERLYTEFEKDFNALTTKLVLDHSMTASVKQLLIKQAQALTEMMDKTIKSLKGSPEYSKDQTELLIERFVKLLRLYHALMKQWMEAIPASQYDKWCRKVVYHTYNHKAAMIALIENIFLKAALKNYDERQLHPSIGFAVESVRVGTNASMERQVAPVDRITLEDLFTWMHQNIIASTAFLAGESQIKQDELPDEVQPLLRILDQEHTFKMDLTSMAYQHPNVKIEYNIPLNNHSAKFVIDFNTRTKELILQGHFFGHNISDRMSNIVKAARLERILFGAQCLHEAEYNAESYALQFSWRFKENQLAQLTSNINSMLTYYVGLANYDSTSDVESTVLKRHFNPAETITLSAEAKAILLQSASFTPATLFPEYTNIITSIYSNEQRDKIAALFSSWSIFNKLDGNRLSFKNLLTLMSQYQIKLDLNYQKWADSLSKAESILFLILFRYSADECLEILKLNSTPIAISEASWDPVLEKNNINLTLELLKQSSSLEISTRVFYQLLAIPETIPLLKEKLSKAQIEQFITDENVSANIRSIKYNTFDSLITVFAYQPHLNHREYPETLLEKICNEFSTEDVDTYLKKYRPDLSTYTHALDNVKDKSALASSMLDLGAPLNARFILRFYKNPYLEKQINAIIAKMTTQAFTKLFFDDINALSASDCVTFMELHGDKIDVNQKLSEFSSISIASMLVEKLDAGASIKFLTRYMPTLKIDEALLEAVFSSKAEDKQDITLLRKLVLQHALPKPALTPQILLSILRDPTLKLLLNQCDQEIYAALNSRYSVFYQNNILSYAELKDLITICGYKPNLNSPTYDTTIDNYSSYFIVLMRRLSVEDILDLLKTLKPNLAEQSEAIQEAIRLKDPKLLNALLEYGAPLTLALTNTGMPALDSVISSYLETPSNYTKMLHASLHSGDYIVSDKHAADILKIMNTPKLKQIILSHVDGPLEHAIIRGPNFISYEYGHRSLMGDLIKHCNPTEMIEFLKKCNLYLGDCHGVILSAYETRNTELISLVLKLSNPKKVWAAYDFFAVLTHDEGAEILKTIAKDQLKNFLTTECVVANLRRPFITYQTLMKLMSDYNFRPDLSYDIDFCSFTRYMLDAYSESDILDFLDKYKPNLAGINDILHLKLSDKLILQLLKCKAQIPMISARMSKDYHDQLVAHIEYIKAKEADSVRATMIATSQPDTLASSERPASRSLFQGIFHTNQAKYIDDDVSFVNPLKPK